MSANVEIIPEKSGNTQKVGYKNPPKHSQFKPGNNANPGGVRKGTVFVAEAYRRLGTLDLDKLRKFKAPTAIEAAVKEAILRAAEADDWQAAHSALKEIADRIDGKAKETKDVTSTVKIQVIFDEPSREDDSSEAPAAALGPAPDSIEFETVQCAGVWETVR